MLLKEGTQRISLQLERNESVLRQTFSHCSDIVFRHLDWTDGTKALVVYADGLTNTNELEKMVIKPLLERNPASDQPLQEVLKRQLVPVADSKQVEWLEDAVQSILYGNPAVFSDQEASALIVGLSDFPSRSIEEPVIEASIRGPREGFTEVLRTNTSMLRRKINSHLLKLDSIELGKLTRTRVVLAYLEGHVDADVLRLVRERMGRIDSKAIIDSNFIEEQIEDKPFSLFPQVQNTERPDTVAASLLEGKVAILVDGSPNALIVPMTFWSGFQAAEDHYERFLYVSAVRFIRILLFAMSLLLPSFYVALTTFHPQMIPANLLISIAASREGIPFPTVIEMLILELMFEGLREAGLRMPRAVGSAVSIVGALVIGEAAVQAGFISAPIVIIVASTGIASFAVPRYSLSLPFRMLRFPLLGLSGSLGFYGIAIGTIFILGHLCMLESFGVPYLSPASTIGDKGMGDTFYRKPKPNRS
ncbi:spore germination protein [Paenibacillus arenilitoris]|uniref:Spore germination protein n=1 Tax=Paenibacillus arenilitoris TaxID=2772299 RepID=A0A927H542_9BACL|nr:spore germination protein [Paenibacillus arenilitoris]MBD2869086.1 spore germination protein [Paenibacillus arenilitoris]